MSQSSRVEVVHRALGDQGGERLLETGIIDVQ